MKRPDNWKLDEPISRRRLLEIGAITTAALLIPRAALAKEIAMSTDLLKAAKDVIKYFNAYDYVNLEGGMDSNVTLKKILHTGSVKNIKDVKDYLDNYMKDRHPHLKNPGDEPWDGTALALITPEPKNETYGRVSGTGLYFDDNDKSKTPISFTLDFVRNSTSDDWSLFHSFAAPS